MVYLFLVWWFQIGQIGDQRYENPQSSNLQRLLMDTIDIQSIMLERKTAEEKELQEDESEERVEEMEKMMKQKEQKKKLVIFPLLSSV